MALATDSSGRLWIGTHDGAAYYNGRKWTIVNLPDRTTSNYVQAIHVASDGAVWLSANRGQVHRYELGQWQSFDTSDGLASTLVRSIQETAGEDREPTFWFGTSRGVSKYSRGHWQTFNARNSTLPSDYVYDICKSADGTLWVATNRGASRYVDGAFHNVELPQGLRDTVVNKILQAKDGALWFAGNGTVGRYANMNWTLFHAKSTKTTNSVNVLHESSTGDMWVGMQSGIAQIRKGLYPGASSALEDFVVGTSLENQMDNIFSIHETRSGVIWFGTLVGLYRYVPGNWKTLDDRTGLTNTAITYIHETSSGDFLFGTTRGLFQYHHGVWKRFDERSGLANNFVKAILTTKDGALWVGTFGGGVQRFSNGRWQYFDEHDGLVDNRVYSILESDNGALWFATTRGVSQLYRGNWTTLTTADGLVGNQVMSLYESGDGAMWFGTRSGLSRLHHGVWQSFTTANGLAGNVVHSINGSSDGSLWYGTFSSGITRFTPRTQTWKTLNDTSSPALPNNVVYQVQEDRQGRLYFLTNKGVTRLSKELVSSAKAQVNLPTEVFTMEDGLPNNEGIVRASIVDSRGRVWAGTTKGVAYFDPAEEVIDTIPKTLIIERISIQNFSNERPLQSGIELTHRENNISFDYALLSFFKESETRYRTQLEPYEPLPSDWTSDYKKEYSNLVDGNYTFRVWGRDYAGNVSGPGEFAFVIHPPFWKTWWFRGFLFLAVVGAIMMMVRTYTAHALKKQLALLERQQMIERERARISQDMHDTVGSSLTRIALLSDWTGTEVQPQRIAAENLTPFTNRMNLIGATAREVIETMDEIIWSLSPMHDSLESLISYMRHFVNTMFGSTSIQHKFNAPESIPDITLSPDFRRNAFLIVKEAVHNVVRHSGASSVVLSVSLSENRLKIEILDDGVGICESSAPESGKVGFGLKNMRERAKAVGAKLEIKSFPQRGTAVRFIAELQTIYTI